MIVLAALLLPPLAGSLAATAYGLSLLLHELPAVVAEIATSLSTTKEHR